MSEAAYPSSIPSFTTKRDQIDLNYAAHINRLQAEVRAISTELGTTPRGNDASVRARLENLQANKSDSSHNHDARYWQRTLVTSKGELLVGTSAENVDALAPAANGRVLKTDAATPTGLKWDTLKHSDFSDLTGDHYPQYALANGTRGAFLRLSGGTMTGKTVLAGHAEKVVDKGAVWSVTDFDAAVGSLFTARMEGNVTVTLSGAVAGEGTTITIVFTQATSGNWNWVWPTSVRWVGPGGAPQPAATGGIALVTLLTVDAGTTWLGVSHTG